MRLIFRVDVTQQIGTGHFMRNLPIIEEAHARGLECIVLGEIESSSWVKEKCHLLGIKIIEPKNFSNEETFSDILIIDSYNYDENYPILIKEKWNSIVCVADSFTPQHSCDLRIEIGLKNNQDNLISGTKILSGFKYFPLRKSISISDIDFSQDVRKVVVFGGGTDPFNFAQSIAKGLHEISIFKNAVFMSDIPEQILRIDKRYSVQPFGELLDIELLDADLVLTTASTSSIEICARQIPQGIFCITSNQIPYYDYLTKSNMALGLGIKSGHEELNIDFKSIKSLMTNGEKRRELVNKSKTLLDFFGAQRIVDCILNL